MVFYITLELSRVV